MQATTEPKRAGLSQIPSSWKPILFNLLLIAVGTIVFVIGMNSVLIPNRLFGGGITGTAMVLHYMFPSLDVGLAYFLLNVPLMLVGWFYISRRFMLYTTFGMGFLSLAAAIIKSPAARMQDPILAALFAGVVCGVGAGIILRSLGSGGGLDILAILGNQKFGFRPGSVSFFFNAAVLLAGAHLFGLEIALYCLIYVFTSTRVLDAILRGFNQRMLTLIISEKYQQITEEIFKRVNRGATFIKGQGAYSGEERNLIFTVTTLTELSRLKDVVFNIDPGAFVVINDTLEVLGKRHGTRKVY